MTGTLRIIGGDLRGRRIQAPPGAGTRPTAERVREAVFNILGGRLTPVRVLDLFAGTGAMGLEALSRGAGRAVFVENRPAAVRVLRRNIVACRLTDRSAVLRCDAARGPAVLQTAGSSFELVFCDPPYNRGRVAPVLAALAAGTVLAPDARVVVEHAFEEPMAVPPVPLVLADRRRYGKTLVSFLRCVV